MRKHRAEYERLLELAEDALDILIVEEALAGLKAGRSETLSHDEVKDYLAATSLVRFWRKRRGLTQAALAKSAGVSRTLVAEVERGKARGDLEFYGKLASVLKVGAEDLMPEGFRARPQAGGRKPKSR